LAYDRIKNQNLKERISKNLSMEDAYLGPSYSDQAIEKCIDTFQADFKKIDDWKEMNLLIATNLSLGKIVGWYQGRMEFGPRALGNRSILADARYANMQQKLNEKIKFRESFRPFAPIVMESEVATIFENACQSPYMLYIDYVKEGFNLSAITHVDRSARLQTVSEESNKKMHALLNTYKGLTGIPVLVNTSFNVRGEPIVNTPEDAYRCFMNSGIDILVMNQYIFYKERQKADVSSFSKTFKPD